jgi:hypothetical protein
MGSFLLALSVYLFIAAGTQVHFTTTMMRRRTPFESLSLTPKDKIIGTLSGFNRSVFRSRGPANNPHPLHLNVEEKRERDV